LQLSNGKTRSTPKVHISPHICWSRTFRNFLLLWSVFPQEQHLYSKNQRNAQFSILMFDFKFDVHMAVHRNTIYIVKPPRCTDVSNLFYLEWHSTCFGRSFRPSSGIQDCTYSNRHMSNRHCCLLASKLHVSDDLSVHHQQFKTVHRATGICQTDTADCLLDTAVCTVLNC